MKYWKSNIFYNGMHIIISPHKSTFYIIIEVISSNLQREIHYWRNLPHPTFGYNTKSTDTEPINISCNCKMRDSHNRGVFQILSFGNVIVYHVLNNSHTIKTRQWNYHLAKAKMEVAPARVSGHLWQTCLPMAGAINLATPPCAGWLPRHRSFRKKMLIRTQF